MIYAVEAKVREYELLCGEIPLREDGLGALVTRPESLSKNSGWVQLYEEIPKDPWGNPIFYWLMTSFRMVLDFIVGDLTGSLNQRAMTLTTITIGNKMLP